MQRKRKPSLPPRRHWPRVPKQSPKARKACEHCGKLDQAVSTRAQLTYYGPSRCKGCGQVRQLRKVERPIDWQRIKETYAIPNDCDVPELRAA